MKEHLTDKTNTVYPDFTDLKKYALILLTDGARTGLGAVLMQRQPDKTERVVQYRARATTKHEAAGSATQLELACLIQALTWFSSILRLGKFSIRTDHVTLVHLKPLKHNMPGKLLRYAILLDSFDYTIEHAKGKSHTLPDALSRGPFLSEETQAAESSAKELDPLSLNSITDNYLREIESTIEGQIKSHSRHYRRHAKILTFAPIEMQDIVEPRANAAQEINNNEADKLQPQAQSQHISKPTVEDIARHAADLPPITIKTQSQNPYFREIINVWYS